MADITGKIIWAGARRQGTNANTGKSWASQDFVIQSVSSGAFGVITTNVVFSVMGEEKLAQWNIQIGDEATVGYGINAHEYNGRWYNDVKAHKYERIAQTQPMQNAPQYAQPMQQNFPPQQPQMGYQPAPINTITAQANPQQYTQQVAAANYGQQSDTQMPF